MAESERGASGKWELRFPGMEPGTMQRMWDSAKETGRKLWASMELTPKQGAAGSSSEIQRHVTSIFEITANAPPPWHTIKALNGLVKAPDDGSTVLKSLETALLTTEHAPTLLALTVIDTLAINNVWFQEAVSSAVWKGCLFTMALEAPSDVVRQSVLQMLSNWSAMDGEFGTGYVGVIDALISSEVEVPEAVQLPAADDEFVQGADFLAQVQSRQGQTQPQPDSDAPAQPPSVAGAPAQPEE